MGILGPLKGYLTIPNLAFLVIAIWGGGGYWQGELADKAAMKDRVTRIEDRLDKADTTNATVFVRRDNFDLQHQGLRSDIQQLRDEIHERGKGLK